MALQVAGHTRQPAMERLGPTLVIAAAIIVAVRTAKRVAAYDAKLHDPEMGAEVGFALDLAGVILAAALTRWPRHFAQREVPWYVPDDGDCPK